MTCREVHARLPGYRTGDLPRGTREEIEGHIALCPSCRAYLDSYDTTVVLARKAGREEALPAPPELEEAIQASLRAARGASE